MAKIPTYDSPLVAPQALPAVHSDARGAAEAYGSSGRGAAALGRGALEAGTDILDIAAQIQHQTNLEKVQAAQAAYGEQTLGWMTDAKTNRIGHKAEGVTKDFGTWNVKTAADIEAGLDNEAQRKAFRSVVQRAGLASKSEIAGFELGEKKKAGVAAYNAANMNAVNIAATAASPQLLEHQRQSILNSVAAFAAAQGLDEEQTKAEREKWTSALHLQRIQNLVIRDAEAARAYFDGNKAEISGSLHEQADKLLKAGELKDGSLRLQFELANLPGLSAQTKELDQRFRDGKISAEMRDATLQRLEHDYNRRKAQQGEWEKSLLGQAQDFLLKNPDKTVQDLPTPLYNGLKNTGHLASIVSFSKNGRFDNDTETWAAIVSMPQGELARMTPTEFYNTYRSKLDDAHLEKGYALLAAARGDKDEKHLSVLSVTEITKRAGLSAGILPASGTPSKDQQIQFGQFENEIDQRVRLFEREQLGGKRKASTDELQKIVDDTLRDIVYQRNAIFPDSQKPISTLSPRDLESAYVMVGGERVKVLAVPPGQRRLIILARRKAGLPITEQAIVETWVKGGRKSD